MFVDAYWVRTSQSQSTRSMIAREASQSAASSGWSGRGPSATTRSFGGRAEAIDAKTLSAVFGRLKITKTTGVLSRQVVTAFLSSRSAAIVAQPSPPPERARRPLQLGCSPHARRPVGVVQLDVVVDDSPGVSLGWCAAPCTRRRLQLWNSLRTSGCRRSQERAAGCAKDPVTVAESGGGSGGIVPWSTGRNAVQSVAVTAVVMPIALVTGSSPPGVWAWREGASSRR